MACGPTALAVPDQRMGGAFRVGCTLNKARGMRALGKVPCGVAWDQSRFRPRTARESTAGDPVTLKASVSPMPGWRDGVCRLPGSRPPASWDALAQVSGCGMGSIGGRPDGEVPRL